MSWCSRKHCRRGLRALFFSPFLPAPRGMNAQTNGKRCRRRAHFDLNFPYGQRFCLHVMKGDRAQLAATNRCACRQAIGRGDVQMSRVSQGPYTFISYRPAQPRPCRTWSRINRSFFYYCRVRGTDKGQKSPIHEKKKNGGKKSRGHCRCHKGRETPTAPGCESSCRNNGIKTVSASIGAARRWFVFVSPGPAGARR